MDERPNALLTKKDREWLASDGELYSGEHAKQQRYNRRKSIRDRIAASLQDFVLLFRALDEKERAKIIDDLDMRPAVDSTGDVTARIMTPAPPSVSYALAFLYLLHEDTDHFELSLRRGLSAASVQRSGTHYQKVEVDIALEEWTDEDFQALKDKIDREELHRLTRAEQDFLIERVDIEVLSTVLEEFEEHENAAADEE